MEAERYFYKGKFYTKEVDEWKTDIYYVISGQQKYLTSQEAFEQAKYYGKKIKVKKN